MINIKKPTVVPIKTISSFKEIPESDFPFYYKPYMDGVEMYVRDGHIFYIGTDARVTNTALLNELSPIRETSIRLRCIIKLTISSKIHNNYIYTRLKEAYYELPEDIMYNFTEAIFREHSHEMGVITGDSNLKLISNGFKNRANWKFHTNNLALDVSTFNKDAMPLLYMDDVIGVTVYKPNSKFNLLDLDKGESYEMLSLKLVADVDGVILNMDSDVEKHGYKEEVLATTLKVLVGGGIQEVNVEDLSQSKRKELWSARHYFKRKKVKVKRAKSNSVGVIVKSVDLSL